MQAKPIFINTLSVFARLPGFGKTINVAQCVTTTSVGLKQKLIIRVEGKWKTQLNAHFNSNVVIFVLFCGGGRHRLLV